MSARERGTVKWFNNFRGYGFITKENGEDIFVHYSAVRMEGFRMLKEGWKVEFSITPSEKGALASDVEVIATNSDQNAAAPDVETSAPAETTGSDA